MIGANGDRLWRIVLQLDRVGTSLRGGVNEFDSTLWRSSVIRRDLCDNERYMTRAHRSTIDFECGNLPSLRETNHDL